MSGLRFELVWFIDCIGYVALCQGFGGYLPWFDIR
jgi:hypothetical protein